MISRHLLVTTLVGAVLLTGCLFTGRAQSLEPIVEGLALPVAIAHAGDGSERLFVVEQRGAVRIVADGALLDVPFLDLRDLVRSGGERGLLGLAFHPDYAVNGRLFVHYTDRDGTSVVAEALVSDDPDHADPTSLRTLLTQPQPFANHNGGQLAFGPDGFLYIALGDGGGGGDPVGAGQDLSTLLGKILRIDVDSGTPYDVPADNPFVGVDGARPEIWAYGLRNPWRFSFDRESGDLFIADVGQNRFEEVNHQPADSAGGENYGWNVLEADSCFAPATDCDRTGTTAPVVAYSHGSGWGRSITGGYLYRGAALPELVGSYLFGDYGSRRVFAAVPDSAGGWEASPLLAAGFTISTFGEDEAGELYLADHQGGALYRLAP
jgi:glucose/arabinose dehydrogenase